MVLWIRQYFAPLRLALQRDNLRRVLRTVEALSDLGPELTEERDFTQTALLMLQTLREAASAVEGVVFSFSERPALMTSIAAQGFALLPDPTIIPLLPKHVHALSSSRGPVLLNSSTTDVFLSSNGNVAPELFRCLSPLKVGNRLVGMVALGRREGEATYSPEDLDGLQVLTPYVALSVHNHALSQTLTQKVSENLRLLASLHGFYDNALEAFATAIDVKHVNIHGHSLRVGRFASGIAEAMGMDSNEVTAIRSAGYLHDIGKVAVDKRLFGKPAALDPH